MQYSISPILTSAKWDIYPGIRAGIGIVGNAV